MNFFLREQMIVFCCNQNLDEMGYTNIASERTKSVHIGIRIKRLDHALYITS